MTEGEKNRRLEAKLARQKMRSRKRLKKILIPLIVVIVVGLVAAYFVNRDTSTPVIEGLIVVDDHAKDDDNLSREHVDGEVSYEQTPPAGGNHRAVWQNCGAYNIPIPNEQAVHSLEHGAIWITYQPDLDRDEVNKLRSITRQRNYTLVSPYDGLPAPIVASAWGYQVHLDSADDPRLQEFIRQYMQGPQTPEPGAACSSGAGQPT